MRVIDRGNALSYLNKTSARVALEADPGTMSGTFGGGHVTAFEERGLTKRFAYAVGVSTGTPILSYFLAGQAALGTSIYYEECTKPNFISWKRGLLGGDFGDIQYLADIFKYGEKKLDVERVRASPTELYFGVTEYAEAKEKFVNAKTLDLGIVHGIHVSCAMPAMYKTWLYIDDVRHNDGAVSCMPIRYTLEKKPDAVVILANGPEGKMESVTKKFVTRTLMLRECKVQREAMRARYERRAADLRLLEDSGIPYTIFYGDTSIGSYTTDPVRLKRAAMRARIQALQALDTAGVR